MRDDIQNEISGILSQPWNIRQGTVVPSEDKVSFTGNVVKLEGTVLYADMRESSKLVDDVNQRVAGKVYQAYLRSIARLISNMGGTITAYDGDRIMGIFLGDDKNTTSGKCALQINFVVSQILSPMLTDHFKTLNRNGFRISHCVGIDTGSFLAVKAGQRVANDIVWIGKPPNLAAKLSEIRYEDYTTFISRDVFSALDNGAKYGGKEKKLMWDKMNLDYLDEKIEIYGSIWYWGI